MLITVHGTQFKQYPLNASLINYIDPLKEQFIHFGWRWWWHDLNVMNSSCGRAMHMQPFM